MAPRGCGCPEPFTLAAPYCGKWCCTTSLPLDGEARRIEAARGLHVEGADGIHKVFPWDLALLMQFWMELALSTLLSLATAPQSRGDGQ